MLFIIVELLWCASQEYCILKALQTSDIEIIVLNQMSNAYLSESLDMNIIWGIQ